MVNYSDCLQTHSSGVGVLLLPPVNTHYRFWRDPGPFEDVFQTDERGNVVLDETRQPVLLRSDALPVLTGYSVRERKFLDWEVSVDEPVHYWLEVAMTENGPWTTVQEWRPVLEPQMYYSAMEDGENYDVSNPRDALVVFFGTRLAQLARAGKLYVRNKARRRKYNVTTAYSFDDADMPVLAIGMGYGGGQIGDLGWTVTEETLRLDLVGMAADKGERDSLTLALRGLIAEVNLFLGDLGCVETSFGQMSEEEQHSEPMLYLVKQSIATTVYTHIGIDAGSWELAPVGGWTGIDLGDDLEGGLIYSAP